MAVFDAVNYDHYSLLQALQLSPDEEVEVLNLNGQRYLGCGWKNSKRLVLHGTAGNNLGAFADGPTILLYGNGQEGVGNTMSDGEIIVYGRVGDIAGYGMRGGVCISGIMPGIAWHMKAYQDKKPGHCCGRSGRGFWEIWRRYHYRAGLNAAITPQLDLIAERACMPVKSIRGEA